MIASCRIEDRAIADRHRDLQYLHTLSKLESGVTLFLEEEF